MVELSFREIVYERRDAVVSYDERIRLHELARQPFAYSLVDFVKTLFHVQSPTCPEIFH